MVVVLGGGGAGKGLLHLEVSCKQEVQWTCLEPFLPRRGEVQKADSSNGMLLLLQASSYEAGACSHWEKVFFFHSVPFKESLWEYKN